MMDYIVERHPDGSPARLIWAPEVMCARREAEAERFAVMRDACTRPMAHLEAWARERGLWQPEAMANR